MLLYSPGSKS